MQIVTAERPAAAGQYGAPPAPRAPAWRRASWPLLAALAIFLLALWPRLVGLEQHLTADDQEWMRRVSRFALALQRGDARGTYQSGHPGVTVLWLAAQATGPARALELAAHTDDLEQLEKSSAYLPALFDARRVLAVTSAGLVALLALLVWRLFGPGPGLLAGLLLAGEPFLVAHGRLLHTDPLLAALMAIAVLAALVFFHGGGSWGYLLLASLATGLALLTKTPAVFLLGFVPLLGAAAAYERRGRLALADLSRLLAILALWGLATGLVCFALWPALRVDPLGTLGRLVSTTLGVGESPRRWGNFFLGQAVDGDVGPLFYPVATLLRLSPITLLGLGLLTWRALRRERGALGPAALVLVDFLLLFTGMMSLSPKKVDRYLLPAYPMLAILAALGLSAAGRRWLPARQRWLLPLAAGAVQLALVASVQPYPLSFYNPLLGGSTTARQAVIVGWGEGLDQVAAFLAAQPNAERIVVTCLYYDLLRAQFPGGGVPLADWRQADYLVDYVNMDQRGLIPSQLRGLVSSTTPLFTVRINGLEYARVYPIPSELKAAPGNDERLKGANVPRP